MGKLAIFSFHSGGSLEAGFKVTLRIGEDGKSPSQEIPGELPPAPEILKIYNRWRLIYPSLGFSLRELRFIKQSSTSLIGKHEAKELADKLNEKLNNWLKYEDFMPLRSAFESELEKFQNIRVIIQTENVQLQRLPWHLWDTFNSYKNAEVAFSSLDYKHLSHSSTTRKKGRILAVLGNSTGIDIKEDQEFLKNLEKETQAEIKFLVEPTQETLGKSLEENEGWDIFFFAGHSFSQADNEDGYISLNKHNRITFDDLEYALKKSVENGLRLAIFNSCDGLGLAKKLLTKYSIPQLIVMREPVPDLVAQKFLKNFLSAFASGQSLYVSMREARQSLQAIEEEFICASWLPVLFQNPAEVPPTWQDLHGVRVERQRRKMRNKLKLGLAVPALALSTFFGYTIATESSPIGDYLSSGEEVLVTIPSPRSKQRGVDLLAKCKEPLKNYLAIFQEKTRQNIQGCFWTKSNYKEAFDLLNKSWKADDKDPETLIYLNNALLEAKGAKYYTIAVVVPIRNKDGAFTNVNRGKEILRGVAQAQTEINLGLLDANDELDTDFPGKGLLEGKAINGRIGLRVIIANDFYDEKEAVERAKALVKKRDILAVVGHWTSEATMATVDIYDENKLVLISPGATTEELTEEPRDFFFRTANNNGIFAKKLAENLIKKGQTKAVVFYVPSSAYTSTYWEKFKEHFENEGGEIISKSASEAQEYDLSNNNFNVQKSLDKVRKERKYEEGKTAIVLIPDGGVTNAVENANKVIEANNNNDWIAGSWSLMSEHLKKLLEKFVVPLPWNPWDSPGQKFNKNTKILWGKTLISSRTATAYDATRVLIEALEMQKKPSRKGMQQKLAAPNFTVEGATGKIQFNRPTNGNRKNPPVVLVHVVECSNEEHGLAFVPIEYSTAEEAGLTSSEFAKKLSRQIIPSKMRSPARLLYH